MLSIIISSYQDHFYNALVENIEKTCGVDYEIIQMKNPGIMGISKAYNMGAKKARYDYYLFLHEDILFHTNNWGEILIDHLSKQNTGIIGVAGSDYVPQVPCGWFVKNPKYQFMHLIQNDKNGTQAELLNYTQKRKQKVFGVDGLFLGIRKKVFQQFLFDENLKGFHGYDLDISLSVAKKYDNYVINDILLEHFSLGGADRKCFHDNILVRKKQGYKYQKITDKDLELERFENFVFSYFRFNGITVLNMLKTLSYIPVHKIESRHYSKIGRMYLRYFRYQKYYAAKFPVTKT